MKHLCFLSLLLPLMWIMPLCGQTIYKGLLPGEFSISPSEKVQFSKGNLEYSVKTEDFRFAENQYSFIEGEQEVDGWLGALPWGFGRFFPLGTSDMNVYMELDISTLGAFDWGMNVISNGGKLNNMWRTLSQDEWAYMLFARENAHKKVATATVCGAKGIVLLPDKWILPSGCTFNPEEITHEESVMCSSYKFESTNYKRNNYNLEQWMTMEKNGAVFIPATKKYGGFSIGWYWTSSSYKHYADVFTFTSENIYEHYIDAKFKWNRMSIRLVKSNAKVLYTTNFYNCVLKDIKFEEDCTIVSCEFTNYHENGWTSVTPEIHILADGQKFKLLSVAGITKYPELIKFSKEGEKLSFILVFEALPKPYKEYESLNIIDPDGFKWQDITILE